MNILPLFLAEDCKKKWKTLRIQQRRLLIKKIRKVGKFQGSQWNCYESLKFLIPHMDWTSAEEKLIKRDSDATGSEEAAIDDDDENLHETMSNEDSRESKQLEHEGVLSPSIDVKSEYANAVLESSPITEQLVFETPPYQQVVQSSVSSPVVSAKSQSLSQFVLTYVPTPTPPATRMIVDDPITIPTPAINSANISSRTTISSKSFEDTYPSISVGATHQIIQTPASSQCFSSNPSVPVSSYQVVSTNNHVVQKDGGKGNNGNGTSATDTIGAGILNYFLLDVSQQMNKLNDIAQMEVKIDIHKLLLEKLKDGKNLRRT